MNDSSKLSVITWNNDDCCFRILFIFGLIVINFTRLLDVFENYLCFFYIFYIIAFLVSNLKKKLTIDGQQMNTISIDGGNRVKLTLELILAPSNLSAYIFKMPYVWICIHNQLPKLHMMSRATFNVVFKIDHLVGILKIFVDLYRLVDLYLVHFHHLSFDSL